MVLFLARICLAWLEILGAIPLVATSPSWLPLVGVSPIWLPLVAASPIWLPLVAASPTWLPLVAASPDYKISNTSADGVDLALLQLKISQERNSGSVQNIKCVLIDWKVIYCYLLNLVR